MFSFFREEEHWINEWKEKTGVDGGGVAEEKWKSREGKRSEKISHFEPNGNEFSKGIFFHIFVIVVVDVVSFKVTHNRHNSFKESMRIWEWGELKIIIMKCDFQYKFYFLDTLMFLY